MFLKKICFVVVVMLFFVSCDMLGVLFEGPIYDDEARIMFKIASRGGLVEQSKVVRFFDTNPYTPDTIAHLWNDFQTYGYRYYKIDPGQYYLEYVIENNSAYYMIYTINIYKDGGATKQSDGYQYMGDTNKYDHYVEFEICLYEDGPRFSDGNPVGVESEPITGEIQKSPFRSISNENDCIRGPIIEKSELYLDGGSMVMEYGRLY